MWSSKKFKNRKYVGRYKDFLGMRMFVLECKLKNGELDTYSFNSWQAAKASGWNKG